MTTVANLDANFVCRICLNRSQRNQQMFNVFDENEALANMIMSCSTVQIYENDGLPHTICLKCNAMLNLAFQFKQQCENSDLKLRNRITVGSSQAIDNTIIEKSSETTEISINKKDSDEKSLKEFKCETCAKTFTRREYLIQHKRTHTGEKPYFCHICGKQFVNSGHLGTHMRTHTGERPHACSRCPKAFITRQELQKHTLVAKIYPKYIYIIYISHMGLFLLETF